MAIDDRKPNPPSADRKRPHDPHRLGQKLVLRATLSSPFGRKVRIAAHVLGLADRLHVVGADPHNPQDTLRLQNPLGKMPCLLLEDGTSIYDSRVIVEYLDSITALPHRRLIPERGTQRFAALTRAALADGIADAAILMVYEDRFRPAETHSDKWLDHQRGKVVRGLAAFESVAPDAGRTDIVSISLACALAYLDWRKQVEWRPGHPSLCRWLDRFSAAEPAFEKTRGD